MLRADQVVQYGTPEYIRAQSADAFVEAFADGDCFLKR